MCPLPVSSWNGFSLPVAQFLFTQEMFAQPVSIWGWGGEVGEYAESDYLLVQNILCALMLLPLGDPSKVTGKK